MTSADILRRLPHRYPVLLVDRVVEVVPGESWCQAAVLLSSWDNPHTGRAALIGSLTDVEFHRPVAPGCVIRHSVRVLSARGDTVAFTGEPTVDGQVVMTVGRVVTTTRAAADLG